MSKIELSDSITSIVTKMSEGNPGAITVLIQLIKNEKYIDPDSAFSEYGVSTMLGLDELGIYGPNIWVLYKDICGQDIENVVGICRAVQLGFLPSHKFVEVITQSKSIDVDDYIQKVKDRLPNFGYDPARKIADDLYAYEGKKGE